MSIMMNTKDGWMTMNTGAGSMTMNSMNASINTFFQQANKSAFGVDLIVKLALIALAGMVTFDLGMQYYSYYKKRSINTKFLLSEAQVTNDAISMQKQKKIIKDLEIIFDRHIKRVNGVGLFNNEKYKYKDKVWISAESTSTITTDNNQNPISKRFSNAFQPDLIEAVKKEYRRELDKKTDCHKKRFQKSFFLLVGLIAYSFRK